MRSGIPKGVVRGSSGRAYSPLRERVVVVVRMSIDICTGGSAPHRVGIQLGGDRVPVLVWVPLVEWPVKGRLRPQPVARAELCRRKRCAAPG